MDSIRPLQNYNGGIVPQAVLNGTLGTVVYASNYNDLDNKPSINSVELRGNKTAEDLGLATPADITVTSVNTQTGDVSLTGQNIPYDSTYSVTEKINDLESQIVDSGVSSVNGHTGAVILTGSDINYSVGVSLNAKIDAVEGEIPVINYPVTSVNGETGVVVLAGSDIEYSAGVSINTQIENVAGDLADLTAEDIPMSGTDSTPTATAIGDISTLTTSDKSSLVGALNEVNSKISDTATTFTLTYPVLADLNVHGTNCWYNPLTKEVSLDIHLYSASGGIKGANQLIATIPTGKRPNATINTYCIAVPKDSNLTDLRSEGVFISTDGTIKCNNFILGTDMKYFALQCKYYIV